MKLKKSKVLLGVFILMLLLGMGGYFWYAFQQISIEKIALISPEDSNLKLDIHITTDKPSEVSVIYWIEGRQEKFVTPITKRKRDHTVSLVLLEPGQTYEYQVVIKGLVDVKMKAHKFTTREADPWMVHDWIKKERPHDSKALGDGMVLMCYRGFPGYIAIVDGKGVIRWYWQDKKLGVRIASLTPRGTILALLAPAVKDEFKKRGKNVADVKSYYLRTGKIGFVGGTEIAEIDLEGKVLWRMNLTEKNLIFHHDLQMNEQHEIMSIYRDYKMYDLKNTGKAKDTLWGDGIMVMDTTGKVKYKWSAWDVWDIEKDEKIHEYFGDRFHFNSLRLDVDNNYLLSTPIENQVWKVNAKTGKLMWKLGKGGDFKMDSSDYFYFQHDAAINDRGELMLFDNGDFSPNDSTKVNKRSRAISFELDTVNMIATSKINTLLPHKFYTSRMGASELLPNGNILFTSSKTGGVMVSEPSGKILWLLNTYFIPYRVDYVDPNVWNKYFKIEKR